MRGFCFALLPLVLLSGCLEGGPTDACAEFEAEALYVDATAPTSEPAQFFIVELLYAGLEVEEQGVPESSCVSFEPETAGEYQVAATYWVEGTDCFYVANHTVQWAKERLTVVVEDYTYRCEGS